MEIAEQYIINPQDECASVKMKSFSRAIKSVVLYSGSRRSRILYSGKSFFSNVIT